MDPFSVFSLSPGQPLDRICLERFREQYARIPVYKQFCDLLNRPPDRVSSLADIPFLPVEFFKTHTVLEPGLETEAEFSSSGTTGSIPSRHFVQDLRLYETSFLSAFEYFYGPVTSYCILALLPSYQERPGSSLIYMVDALIKKSGHPESGFISGPPKRVSEIIRARDSAGGKVLLLGVSFALLDLALEAPEPLSNTVVMETGGMKGRRKEMVRDALHATLTQSFGVECIHSEYGMTELLSQAYSQGGGRFRCPPWMRVLIRDPEDPFSYLKHGQTGGLNIIDLANRHSCSFLAVQDLGKTHSDGSFEVLGRFDHSDIRGCNLMAL